MHSVRQRPWGKGEIGRERGRRDCCCRDGDGMKKYEMRAKRTTGEWSSSSLLIRLKKWGG
jgi:hypothetical protein